MKINWHQKRKIIVRSFKTWLSNESKKKYIYPAKMIMFLDQSHFIDRSYRASRYFFKFILLRYLDLGIRLESKWVLQWNKINLSISSASAKSKSSRFWCSSFSCQRFTQQFWSRIISLKSKWKNKNVKYLVEKLIHIMQ